MKHKFKKLEEGVFWAKTFAEGISDAVVVLDAETSILWWNKVAGSLFSMAEEDHLGQRVTDVIEADSLREFIKDRQRGTVEFPLPNSPNLMLSIVIIPYGGLFLLVAQDVSSRHHIDRMRQDFVANVSHEMRTPLTVIQGYLEMMKEEVVEALPHWQVFIEQMNQQMQRLESLLEDLLLLSKLQSHNLEESDLIEVNIPSLLTNLIADAKSLTSKHQFLVDIDEKLNLFGQEKELSSCFGNLIVNAIRYSPDGGDIKIKWYQDRKGAHFNITDQGIGVAKKYIPRLTERFYRVDKGRSRSTGGTGLGLSIVKHVLLRHNANLIIKSRIGIGSSFICNFPKYKGIDKLNG